MMTFKELGLVPELVNGLGTGGITVPTPIQERAIPVLLDGRDVYVSSATGTGKTLAYLLPLFQRIDTDRKTIQAMVIAPTHELAMQIFKTAKVLADHSGLGVRSQVLIGGVAVKRQLGGLKKKPHLIVGSAGRILHLIGLKKINPHTITTVVVDEVDRLLCGDSAENVRKLVGRTARDKGLVFVSATVQPASLREVGAMAPDVCGIHVDANQVSPTITHQYILCEEREKPDILRKLMHALTCDRAIAFVHRNRTAQILADRLSHHKLPVADIHGAHDKIARQQGLDDLRQGRVRLLLASDVAARGLDIRNVTHIFNVDIPSNSKDYLHRVGRTGRAGAEGRALSLVTPKEVRIIQRFNKELGIDIQPVRLFKGRVVAAKKNDD
ncbi:DEAD/DEAH box helicase [Desulfoplanes sp.]